jgi:phage-related minor tail protein
MIGNNEEAKIGVKLDLDLSNVDSAFGKIQKEIKVLGDRAEVSMAKLNPKSDMYKSLLKDYEKLAVREKLKLELSSI